MNQQWNMDSSNTNTTATDSTSPSAALTAPNDSNKINGAAMGGTPEINMVTVKKEASPRPSECDSTVPPPNPPSDNSAFNNQMYPASGADQSAYHHQSSVPYNYGQQYVYGSPAGANYPVLSQQSHQMYSGPEYKPTGSFNPYMTNTSNTSNGSISPRAVSSTSPAVMVQNGLHQQEIKSETSSSHYVANYNVKQGETSQSDILDLDSQRVVGPHPNSSNIRPLDSLQSMYRPSPMIGQQWVHNGQNQDLQYLQQVRPPQDPQETMHKVEENSFSPSYTLQQPPQQPKPPYSQNDSSSEYISTTTNQDGLNPNLKLANQPLGKAANSWKSNEPRRPKTYKCTACNKWFTSSGHLKRHYNTTLHKNAVKASNEVDPATLPISCHHFPDRDPNAKQSRPRHSRPAPVPRADSTASPEYGSQYSGHSPGFQQSQQQNFSNFQQQNLNGHPNGLAGPSIHNNNPSHQRGLLNNLRSEAQITTTLSLLPGESPMELDPHTIKQEDNFNQPMGMDPNNNQNQTHHLQVHQSLQHLQHQQIQMQQQPEAHIITSQITNSNHQQDTTGTTQHHLMQQETFITMRKFSI